MSTPYETIGEIEHIGETESRGEKGFQVRLIVLETDPDSRWPQSVPFELQGKDNVILADAFKEGETVRITWWLKGRRWKDRWFTTLRIHEIERLSAPSLPDEPEEFEDDIPF